MMILKHHEQNLFDKTKSRASKAPLGIMPEPWKQINICYVKTVVQLLLNSFEAFVLQYLSYRAGKTLFVLNIICTTPHLILPSSRCFNHMLKHSP